MFRERALGTGAITEIFSAVHEQYRDLPISQLNDPFYAKANLPFAGELYMGHLRYSTTGKSGISYIHPFLRRNNWRAKNLALCGNFNLTNVDEIFQNPANMPTLISCWSRWGTVWTVSLSTCSSNVRQKGCEGWISLMR